MKYLIHCTNSKKETTAAWVEIPRGWSSDNYGKLQEEFVQKYGQKDATNPYDKYATMTHIFEQAENGMPFDWELCNGGATFLVFWLPEFNAEQVVCAVEEIRHKRDVVRLNVVEIKQLVEWPIEE